MCWGWEGDIWPRRADTWQTFAPDPDCCPNTCQLPANVPRWGGATWLTPRHTPPRCHNGHTPRARPGAPARHAVPWLTQAVLAGGGACHSGSRGSGSFSGSAAACSGGQRIVSAFALDLSVRRGQPAAYKPMCVSVCVCVGVLACWLFLFRLCLCLCSCSRPALFSSVTTVFCLQHN